MYTLFNLFFRIALLRAGPQVLPTSRELLALVLLLHWLIGAALAAVTESWVASLAVSLVGTLLMVAMIQGALMVRHHPERLWQTATALGGCEVLLGLLLLPLTIWFNNGGDKGLIALLSLAVLGWNLAIAGHVFRHALNIGPGAGFAVGTGYMLLTFMVAGMISPGA